MLDAKDFPTYGAYLRAKNFKIAYCRSSTNERNDSSAQKKWDRDLEEYRKVRAQGIQPDTTQRKDVEMAKIISDISGEAYNAS